MKNLNNTVIMAFLFMAPIACDHDVSSTPIAPPPPVTVSVISPAGYKYLSGGVTLSSAIGMTIVARQAVIWDNSNASIHPLYLDDGSTCLQSNYLAYPLTQTFNMVGTYNFHCGFHGSCAPNNTTCPLNSASCTGLTSFIVVK